MASLNEYDLPNQARAVAMLADNAADQLRRFADDPFDASQIKTTRNACKLARDTLDGFSERLPKPKRSTGMKG